MHTTIAGAVSLLPPSGYFVHPRAFARADDRTAHSIRPLLDAVRGRILDYEVATGMDLLCDELASLRRTLSAERWKAVIDECRASALRDVVGDAPISRRAAMRPRGYPGDAETLDLVYGAGQLPAGLTPLGAALYGYELQMTAAVSVRARREILAALIDEVASQRPDARILSIACGHVREAERSEAVASRSFAAFDALDQDAESLALVEREHAPRGLRPIPGSVRALLAGKVALSDYDLVYAAGLYDYLERDVAARLTATLFAMLRPGGRLLVANFAYGVRETAYMEAYMDWPLIYRDESDVDRFASLIDPAAIAGRRLYRDAPRNVIYLELQRA
ncbi:MAG TPA: class I SAM-dependent methyltransferase [Gemmatimonadaceae bacterium]|nr:class I SAM-dependent methyltransferase [Gemmatimonadaceae bacterium]